MNVSHRGNIQTVRHYPRILLDEVIMAQAFRLSIVLAAVSFTGCAAP